MKQIVSIVTLGLFIVTGPFFIARDLFAETGKPGMPNRQSLKDYGGNIGGGFGGGSFPKLFGPSGKPKIHTVKLPGRKKALDAIKRGGHGHKQKPIKHYRNKQGNPHFHPRDKKGNKKLGAPHYQFPK